MCVVGQTKRVLSFTFPVILEKGYGIISLENESFQEFSHFPSLNNQKSVLTRRLSEALDRI